MASLYHSKKKQFYTIHGSPTFLWLGSSGLVLYLLVSIMANVYFLAISHNCIKFAAE